MSVINEALKKAQKEKEFSVPAAGGASSELRFHKKSGFNWGPIFVLLVLFLITGPIIAPFFAAPFKKEAYAGMSSPKTISVGQNSFSESAVLVQKNQPGLLTGSPSRKSQFAVEESILLPQAGPFSAGQGTGFRKNFHLSGIVYSPKESYCIINDKIVKAGEQVGGATLVEITPEKVVLDYQGSQITLI